MSTNQIVRDKLNIISELYVKTLMELELSDDSEGRGAVLANFFMDVEVVIQS